MSWIRSCRICSASCLRRGQVVAQPRTGSPAATCSAKISCRLAPCSCLARWRSAAFAAGIASSDAVPSSSATGAPTRSAARDAPAPGGPRPVARSISRPTSPWRIARQRFSSISRCGRSSIGSPSSCARARRAGKRVDERRERLRLGRGRAARRRCGSRPSDTRDAGERSTRSACARRSSRCRRGSERSARSRSSRRTASGTPQRGNMRVKISVRAECSRVSRPRRTESSPTARAARAGSCGAGCRRRRRGRRRGCRRARAARTCCCARRRSGGSRRSCGSAACR